MIVAVERWNEKVEMDVPDTADVVVAEPRPEHPALADPLAALLVPCSHCPTRVHPYGL